MKLCDMTSLVDMAQSVRVEKADGDGRWIKAGVNDTLMASRGERKAARKQSRRDGLKAFAAGTAGGAALGAGGLLAARGKIKRSAMKAGATKEGFNGVFGSAKNTAAAGAFYGGTAGGAIGGTVGSNMGATKGAKEWREKEGLEPRGAWGNPKYTSKRVAELSKGAPSIKTLAAVTDPRRAAKLQGRMAAKIKAKGGTTWDDVARRGSESRAASRGINTNGPYGQAEAHLRSGVAPWQVASKADKSDVAVGAGLGAGAGTSLGLAGYSGYQVKQRATQQKRAGNSRVVAAQLDSLRSDNERASRKATGAATDHRNTMKLVRAGEAYRPTSSGQAQLRSLRGEVAGAERTAAQHSRVAGGAARMYVSALGDAHMADHASKWAGKKAIAAGAGAVGAAGLTALAAKTRKKDKVEKGLPSSLRNFPHSPNAKSQYGRSLQWRKKVGQIFADDPATAAWQGKKIKVANVHNMHAGR